MFDGLLLFRPLSPILSESVMTEPDTMTYIRAGSCVRTCSSIRIYVWPDATVCVARCVRTHFTNRGMCQNVDNAVVSFLGAGFACPKTQSKLFSGERTSPLPTKRQHYPHFEFNCKVCTYASGYTYGGISLHVYTHRATHIYV